MKRKGYSNNSRKATNQATGKSRVYRKEKDGEIRGEKEKEKLAVGRKEL